LSKPAQLQAMYTAIRTLPLLVPPPQQDHSVMDTDDASMQAMDQIEAVLAMALKYMYVENYRT
jgi:hypothetical protein